jgi:2-aminoadipate transaminase
MAGVDADKERGIIDFGRGNPPPEAFPTQQLQECAATILAEQASVVLQYYPAAGYAPLRGWLANKYGLATEGVLVSNGSLQILDFVSRLLTSPGDVVLVEKPTYDRAITIFRRAGARIIGVPLEYDGFDVDAVESLAKTEKPKLFYVIADFQNPKGSTTSLSKRKKLVQLAERHDFWIVEDGPYRDLRYSGEKVPTVFSLGSQRVLHLSSFSKVLSPGMRVGYILGPEQVVSKLAKVAEDTYVTANMPSQGTVYEYCRRGWLRPNIERLKGLYRPKLEALASALEAYLPQARWTKPEGGYFIGVYLPPEVDTSLLQVRAQEVGVRLSDGGGFFPDRSGDAFVRLPFCALAAGQIREGIERLGSVVGVLTG